MRSAIICDLDGTLCNIDHRIHLVKQNKWDEFYDLCSKDTLNEWCAELLDLYATHLYDILLVSGRPEKVRYKTENWLKNNGILYKDLITRADGDYCPDDELKEKIYRYHIEPYYRVAVVIDDRQRVVDMWRRLGLVCLQCTKGDY